MCMNMIITNKIQPVLIYGGLKPSKHIKQTKAIYKQNIYILIYMYIYINNLINVSVNTFLRHYLQQNYYQALINL